MDSYYQNEERIKLYYNHIHNGGDPLASITSIKKEKDGIIFTAKLNKKRSAKMKRLGKFTGTIYNEDYDFSKCPECCDVLTDSQANDSAFIEAKKLSNRAICTFCMACPAAMESKKLDDDTSEESDSVIADYDIREKEGYAGAICSCGKFLHIPLKMLTPPRTYIECPECGYEIVLYTSKGGN